ncbi:MAG: transposase [Candidatus Methylumidiphilus sp.]
MRRGVRRGGPQRPPRGVEKKGRKGRRRRLKGACGRGTLEKEKPPILGMLQRGGEVVARMLENVQQKAIKPLILATVAPGTTIDTTARHLRPPARVGLRPPGSQPLAERVCPRQGECRAVDSETCSDRFQLPPRHRHALRVACAVLRPSRHRDSACAPPLAMATTMTLRRSLHLAGFLWKPARRLGYTQRHGKQPVGSALFSSEDVHGFHLS